MVLGRWVRLMVLWAGLGLGLGFGLMVVVELLSGETGMAGEAGDECRLGQTLI